MDVLPLDEQNKSRDKINRLTALLSCMFNDSFYHRNFNHKLLILTTAVHAAIAGFLLTSRLTDLYGMESFLYILFTLFIALFGIATIEQLLINHERAGYSFKIIYRLQKTLGYLDKGFFVDNLQIIDLPERYKEIYSIDLSKKPHLYNAAVYAVGKRGYVIYSIYVILFGIVLNIIIFSKLLLCSYNLIVILVIIGQIIYLIVRIMFKSYRDR